jgi:hypothetical protein
MIVTAAKWIVGGVALVAVGYVAKRLLIHPKMPACDDSIRAVHFGGTRPASQIRLIVIHSTEGDTAAGAAGWFANDASEGSAHVVVDQTHCYRTLPDDVIPWGAKGDRVNEDGLHIEQAGYAKWSRDEWMANRSTIDNAARVVAAWAYEYHVPLRFLTADDLRAQGSNARGITSHVEVTRAFDVSGGHVDPGVEYPIDYFMSKVRSA